MKNIEKELMKFGALISEKYLLPEKHLGITSRQANYWKSRNILPFFEKEKKGFMDMQEALWILIINELSKIGIDTTKLKSLSEAIWIKPFKEKYADAVFRKLISENKVSEKTKKILEQNLNYEIIMETVFRREFNPFTDAFKSYFTSNKCIVSFVYCARTGEHTFNYNTIGITSDLNNLYYGETLIVIPFLPLLTKILGIEIERSNSDLEYLSTVENQIRRVLFFDKPKLLEIELQQNGLPKIIKITEKHKKAEELAKFFLTNNLPAGSKLTIEKRSQGNYKVTIKA
jgi:hypothetical protein